jgi:hypothetical protein
MREPKDTPAAAVPEIAILGYTAFALGDGLSSVCAEAWVDTIEQVAATAMKLRIVRIM